MPSADTRSALSIFQYRARVASTSRRRLARRHGAVDLPCIALRVVGPGGLGTESISTTVVLSANGVAGSVIST